MTSGPSSGVLVRARSLTKDFAHAGGGLRRKAGAAGGLVGGHLRAVDSFEVEIAPGEAVGLVGESGSGKTTVARCLLRLIKPTAGEIFFDGASVLALRGAELSAFRRQAQIVFQDPFASLDPRFTVLRALAEPLRVHRMCDRSEIPYRAAELLQKVGLSDDFSPRYRHELSGGEAQRVSIARALATGPRFLILDEPTSALDASARLKVITLLRELGRELGITYLVISHDLSVIRHLCDRVLVMYLGRIVEEAPAAELFANPCHPYTQALLSATPILRGSGQPARIRLRGEVESSFATTGCPLAPRCPHAVDECTTRPQRLQQIAPSHSIACHRVSEGQIVLSTNAPETLTAQTGEDRR